MSAATLTWRPAFSGGALAALKWLALVAMTVDHVDAFVFQRTLGTDVGRLVFPVFAFVLAYNLARPSVDAEARRRILQRLVLFGLAALPFHALLAAQLGGWWPLNIMLTFAAVVAVVDAIERGAQLQAAGVFLVAGAVVEYWWPGLAFALAVWWLYKAPAGAQDLPLRLAGVLGWCGALGLANGSHWALVALPLLVLASRVPVELPRLRWAFYAYYPVHLAALWLFGASGAGA